MLFSAVSDKANFLVSDFCFVLLAFFVLLQYSCNYMQEAEVIDIVDLRDRVSVTYVCADKL